MNKIRYFLIILLNSMTFFSRSQSLSVYNFNLDSTIAKSDFQLYLIGENHKYKKKNLVMTEIWSTLKTKVPINNIIIEGGIAVEYMMGHFVNDKRTEFKYNKRRKVNVLGKNGNKIYKFIGRTFLENTNHYYIDIEIPRLANIAILDILTRNCNKLEIDSISELIHEKIDKLNFNKREMEISEILISELLLKKESLKKTISPVDFEYLIRIIDNLKKSLKVNNIRNIESSSKHREMIMYDNLKKILSAHPAEKFIGAVGQIHILDTLPNTCFANICNWASMAYKLKKEFKVCVITSYHKKKKLRFTELITDKLEVNNKLLTIKGEDHFDSQKKEFIFNFLETNSKSEFNLFPLSAEYIYDPGSYYNYIIYCR